MRGAQLSVHTPARQIEASQGTQAPLWQVAQVAQVAPLFPVGLEQSPVAGSQLPATWQVSRAVQVTPAQQFALQTPSAHLVNPPQHRTALGAALPAVVQQAFASQT